MKQQRFVRRQVAGAAIAVAAFALAACAAQPTSPASVATPQTGDASRELGFLASPMPTGQVGATGGAGSPALSTDPAAPSTGAQVFGTTTAGEAAAATTPTTGLGSAPALATPEVAGITVQQVTVEVIPANDSGISGTATLADIGGGRTRVAVLVTGSTATHEASIVEGRCADAASVSRWPLSDVRNGSSTTEIDVPLAQLTDTPSAIHVAAGLANPTPAACGNIQRAG